MLFISDEVLGVVVGVGFFGGVFSAVVGWLQWRRRQARLLAPRRRKF